MKILGHTKIRPRMKDVVVGYDDHDMPIVLRLSAPRLNRLDEIEATMPLPLAPATKEVKRDKRGRPLKDAAGNVQVVRDENDPKHLKVCERVEKARTIAMIVECLVDGQVEYETPKPTNGAEGEPVVDYYHRIWSEFEQAGLDTGAYRSLTNAAVQLSMPMSAEEVEEAKSLLGTDDASQEGVAEGK